MTRPANTSMMFDPHRIRILHERTTHCVDSISKISHSDPAADHAISICRSIAVTLNEMWLPMLRDVLALISFSEYESAFDKASASAHGHYSGRFAPRWVGRAHAASLRRERAVLAAQTACDAPWLRRTPRHLTTWTWSELRDTLGPLRTALHRGADISESLHALDQVMQRMASDAISDPSPALGYASSRGPQHLEARSVLDELLNVLALLGSPGIHRVDQDASYQFGQASRTFGVAGAFGSVGASFAALVNLWLGNPQPTSSTKVVSRNEGLLPTLVRNGALLNILSAQVGLLENQQLIDLAAGVLEETARLRSVTSVGSGLSVAFSVGPIMAEILSRDGGVAAMISSSTARRALLGRPEAPGADFGATLRTALADGTAKSAALNPQQLVDPAMDLVERGELFELFRLVAADLDRLKLHPAVSRNLAVAFGPILGDLLPHLEEVGTVIVTLLARDGSVPRQITLGRYQEVAGVFGHIMHDATSQMVLGLAVGQVVTDQSAEAAQWLQSNPEFPEPLRHIQSTFADSRRAITLLANGREVHDEHLAFALGMSISRATTAVNLLSLTLPAARIPVSRLVNMTFPMLLSALDLDEITQVPSLGLESDLSMLYSSTALRIPIDFPDLRARLGLSSVAAATWNRYETLIDKIERSESPIAREETMSLIRALLREDPELHGYLTAVRAGSGDL